jgi:hypothetical protein
MMRGGTFALLLNFDAHGSNFLSDARKAVNTLSGEGPGASRAIEGKRGPAGSTVSVNRVSRVSRVSRMSRVSRVSRVSKVKG